MIDVGRAAERGRSRSSRRSKHGAGWDCDKPGDFGKLRPSEAKFSWLRPSVLWRSRNDVLAHWFGDPSGQVRERWVQAQLERGRDPRRPIEHPLGDSFSFLVIGDPGEGDASQYAVVPGLLKLGEGTAFAVIASDVIYPTGATDDYGDKFFRAYSGYPGPVYAVPGNHDWYDGLGGFMRVFCGSPKPMGNLARGLAPFGLRGLLWRKPEPADEDRLVRARELRGRPEQQTSQPAPYWVIDTGRLRIVGIDAGIRGNLDAQQGAWLRSVSKVPGPKILISGKPLYVNNTRVPGGIDGSSDTVDDIVRDPASGYVAVIGGDVHNYQRYPVPVGDRTIQYVVSGGGGAFMHATHTINRVNVGGVHEDAFKCYPLRGDSLSLYSLIYSRRRITRWMYIPPDVAVGMMAKQIGIEPPRDLPEPVTITSRHRWAARLLGALPWPFRLPVGTIFQRWISEFSDWDNPPFFKSFLHVQVRGDELRIRCFAATGCLEHEQDPPLEDEVSISLR